MFYQIVLMLACTIGYHTNSWASFMYY